MLEVFFFQSFQEKKLEESAWFWAVYFPLCGIVYNYTYFAMVFYSKVSRIRRLTRYVEHKEYPQGTHFWTFSPLGITKICRSWEKYPFLFLFSAGRKSHWRTGFWLAIKGRGPLQVVVSFLFIFACGNSNIIWSKDLSVYFFLFSSSWFHPSLLIASIVGIKDVSTNLCCFRRRGKFCALRCLR